MVLAALVAKVWALRRLSKHALFTKLLLSLFTLVLPVFVLELALRPLVPWPA